MRVTIQDIARRLNLSHTTVSRVLNDRADKLISEETRRRVLEVAAEMGYRGNRWERTLARRRSEMLGAVVPSAEDPFFAALAAYLNRRAKELGYRILFELTEPGADNRARLSAAEQLLDWHVDGLLVWWADGYRGDMERATSSTPAVFLGTDAPSEAVDAVLVDAYAATRSAAEHLLKLGHRHFCFLGPRGSDVGPSERALQDLLMESSLPPPIVRQCASASAEDARTQAYEFFRAPRTPTALLCHSDAMAFGALRGLRDAGLKVPEDLSVVGFGDTWASGYVDPPLTTVALPYRAMVDCALQFLINRATAEEQPEQQRVMLSHKLLPRGSTAPPRT